MRSVSLQEFEEHPAEYMAEVEAGNRLTVVRGNIPVATIHPSDTQSYPLPPGPDRDAAIQDLMEMLRKGWDMKGYRFNRDELYDDSI